MLTIRIATTAMLLCVSTASHAQEFLTELIEVQKTYRAGDLDGALRRLEPLLKSKDLDETSKQRARDLAARILQQRGEMQFRQARIAESIADFDRQIQLHPDRAPEHWQRGIAYYYAGEYEKGARQFELHQTYNPQDVENAAWHFLCVVRKSQGTLETGRKNLIQVTRDRRVPMAEIHQMFAGTMTPEEVLKAGHKAGGTAMFYANLYAGLYCEILGHEDQALRLLKLAADDLLAENNYMRDVAGVHLTLRKSDMLRRAKRPAAP